MTPAPSAKPPPMRKAVTHDPRRAHPRPGHAHAVSPPRQAPRAVAGVAMMFQREDLSDTVTLYLGDCLEVLPTLAAGSVDAVVTDPPYSINTKSDGQGKLSPWADRVNAAYWYKEWIVACRNVMLGSGCLWSFTSWRTLTTIQKVSDDIGWPIESVLVWDKCWIGPGGMRGLRPSYELVALFAGDNFSIKDRGIPDIQRFKWSSDKPSGHPAEKPLSLMRWIIENSTAPGCTVLDAFMGSGTAGVAAVLTGRKFIGVEVDEKSYAIARRRILEALAQPALFQVE